MLTVLRSEEIAVARWYKHERFITPEDVSGHYKTVHCLVCALHNIDNQQLKKINILSHIVKLYGYVFHALAKVTSLMICIKKLWYEI